MQSCGNGTLQEGEECDDGNRGPGDGCGADCKPEFGYTCADEPSQCKPTCGDGNVIGTEPCDDGNEWPDDGCTSCQVDHGYTCTGSPSLCLSTCNDKVVASDEGCDDGNNLTGDGCDDICEIEYGFTCTGEPSVCNATCGDGKPAGTEQCDDKNEVLADGCSHCTVDQGFTCTGAPSSCHSMCGDNVKASDEECEDGNLMALDGCSPICVQDMFSEQEPNNDANGANGPYEPGVLINGSINPRTDVDVFLIMVPALADLRLETFDGPSHSTCSNVDTIITLLGSDGTTVLATDDDSGQDKCSLLQQRRLPRGLYHVRVESGSGTSIPAYALAITFEALCGNSLREGSEECDGTAGCSADCERIPVCGDGYMDGSEECDDGLTANGDGCSAICMLELMMETEPNDSAAQSNGPFTVPLWFGGSITPVADQDFLSITLPTTVDLRVETSDATGLGSCQGLDTVLTLFATDGTTELVQRDQGGVDACSRIDPTAASGAGARHLAAGTYFIKVEDYLNNSVIPDYRVWVTATAVCGNGLVEGAEECDGTPGCTSTCDRVPACGDGLLDAPEQCDDRNTAPGDGCSATCQWEWLTETEPNNTAATANGPYVSTTFITGSINPGSDVDYYAVHLTSVTDLRIETFDGTGPGSCSLMDTVVTLYGTDGTTVLVSRDDGGISACSLVDDEGSRHLAPGTYYVKVEDFGNNSLIPAYLLQITFVAVCGDGVVQGAEECDGSANCDASCNRIPTCGDGFVDGPESCDDRNTTSGDGCSNTCQAEAVAEVEPNNTSAEADSSWVVVTSTVAVSGSISWLGDVDVFRMNLAAPAVVMMESMMDSITCGIATHVELRNTSNEVVAQDDASGMGLCSFLTVPLPAGTYYVAVQHFDNTATIPSYLLAIRVLGSEAAEVEPNETTATATTLMGTTSIALGGHQDNGDVDFYAIQLGQGASLRAEVVEGGTETCENMDVDSLLTLYDAAGWELVQDDDGGRGFCSLLDGLGADPMTPGAHQLPPGIYYLAVEAAPFAQGDSSGQFDYRLVFTAR